MSKLFGRSCVVIVGDVRVEGLRVAFDVKKSTKPQPNTAEIRIFNLSDDTRAKITGTGLAVSLSAGYTGNAAVLFQGATRGTGIDHLREGADWITRLRCGDGERQLTWARVSESFGPGTSIGDVVRHCAKALGLSLGNLDAELDKGDFRGGATEFAHGYAVQGNAARELDRLLRTVGLAWSVQEGSLLLLRGGAPASSAAASEGVLLTPETGLLGSPEHNAPDQRGAAPLVKLRSLLQPQIRCGGKLDVRAAKVKGIFRPETVQHVGDTHGDDWFTNCEAQACP